MHSRTKSLSWYATVCLYHLTLVFIVVQDCLIHKGPCLAFKVQCSFMIVVPSSFLRSVAYREFIRMVYGILGRRRIPLPACAYHEIRKTFPVTKDRSFTGFEMDEDDV